MRELVEANLRKRKNHEIRDENGGATALLADTLKVNAGSLAATLRLMEQDGIIYRDVSVKQKRTYVIGLANEDDDPTPPANGKEAVVSSKGVDFLAQLERALQMGEDLVDGLLAENKRLQQDLAAARQEIEAQQLQIAALGRQILDARPSAALISDIEKKLAELKKIG